MNCRVISLPGRGGPNPYIDLFYDALSKYHIDLVGSFSFNEIWFHNNIDSFDAVHLHWPELIWRKYTPELVEFLEKQDFHGSWKIAKFVERIYKLFFQDKSINEFHKCLKFLKSNEKKIIWTWHNIEPHEDVGNQDINGYKILAYEADLIIFHSEYAQNQCRNVYNVTGDTVVMPHGNYDGAYPPPRDRSTVLREIGLAPDLPVAGCLGAIRNYKGFDIACQAISKLNGKVQLLCAGRHQKEIDKIILEKEIKKINGAVYVSRFITEQEFSDYANACDILLLPYKKITGSGALLVALTLGKCVVASDLPYFREILQKYPKTGILVKPCDPDSLSKGIMELLQVPGDVRKKLAHDLSEEFDWDQIVGHVVPYFLKEN